MSIQTEDPWGRFPSAKIATGSTIVQIDNNGDGVIDAEFRKAIVAGLTADDFVLSVTDWGPQDNARRLGRGTSSFLLRPRDTSPFSVH
ncbi:hypothetical protein [Antarctobacter sp.]|uniref:hypothetical protein n=1 Tax=Antarctobacter sp. TaxID=1872577 RepID=UPI003A90DB3D